MSTNALDPNSLISALTSSSAQQDALNKAAIQQLFRAQAQVPEVSEAQNQPATPQLQFGGSGHNWSDAVAYGLGNFANNFYQVKDYNRKVKMLDRAAGLQRQQMEAQQIGLLRQQQAQAQQRADMVERQKGLIAQRFGPDAANYYAAASPEAQDKFYGGFMEPLTTLATQGDLISNKTKAETAADLQAVQDKLNALNRAGVDLNTPEGQNVYNAVMGGKPVTQADINEQELKLQQAGANIANTVAGTESTQTSTEGQAIKNVGYQYDNALKNLNVIKAAVESAYTNDNAAEDLQAKRLKNQITENEISQLGDLQQLTQNFFDKASRGEVTKGDVLTFTTAANILTKHDPKFAETIKGLGYLDKNGKLDPKAFEGLTGDSSLTIQPAGQHGTIMQDPATGKWFDTSRRAANGLPAEVAAPMQQRQAPPQVKPAYNAKPRGLTPMFMPMGIMPYGQ